MHREEDAATVADGDIANRLGVGENLLERIRAELRWRRQIRVGFAAAVPYPEGRDSDNEQE